MYMLSGNQPPPSSESNIFPYIKNPLQLPKNYSNQWINASLVDQYAAAINNYCLAANATIELWHPLRHPLCCFYRRGKQYYLTFPFQDTNSIRRNRYRTLNSSCWQALFAFWNLPIQGCEYYVQNLYCALISLLEYQQLSRADALLQHIIILYPEQGTRLYQAIQCSLQTISGLLLLNLEEPDLRISSYHYALWSEGLLRYYFFNKAASFPSKLLRSLFREFRLSSKPKSNYGPLPFGAVSQAWGNSITYVLSERLHRVSPPFTANKEGFLVSYGTPISPHSEKLFPATPISLTSVPANAELLLYMLTSGSTKKLDCIATLFFEIMTNRPTLPNMTVLYAPLNAERIQALFSEIFCLQTAFSMVEDHSPPRLSTLTQKKRLMALAAENVYGKALLLIDDSMPSESVRPTCRKLIKEKSIKLNDACADGQHFSNQIHFLCITGSKKKADALAMEFSAHLLDLSADEQLIPPSFSLASEDINWLITSFALHGLFLRLIDKSTPDGSDSCKTVRKKPAVEDGLLSFLETCCIHDSGCITGQNLYSAYCDYYNDVRGCPPPYTKIIFVKRMRDYCSTSKKAVYKRSRQNIPKTQSPPHQFLGISLRENWRQTLSAPGPFRIPLIFHATLRVMNDTLPEEFIQSADAPSIPALNG